MAVTYVGAGAAAGNAANTTQAISSNANTQIGDILICQLINKSATANATSAPDGTWTQIAEGVTDATAAADDHQYSLWWKRVQNQDGAQSYTFSKTTDDNVLFYGIISTWRGAKGSGSPLGTTRTISANTAVSDNITFAAFDPTFTDSHIAFFGYYGNDLTTMAAAMSSDVNPNCTTRYDVETTTGTDATLACTSGDTTDGSNIASRTWASASSADSASTGIVIELVVASSASDTYPTEAVSYVVSDTASDLTATGATFNKAMVESGAVDFDWSGQSIGANASVFTAGFTPSGDPGTNGQSNAYVRTKWFVQTGNANLLYGTRVHRVDSSGTIQASTQYVETPSGATGIYWLVSPGIADLGTWNSGDRLRVDFRIRNTSGSAGQSAAIDFNWGGVQTPWADAVSELAYGDTNRDITLSGSDLIATMSGTADNISGIRGTVQQLNGQPFKVYFEARTTSSVAVGNQAVGISNEIGGQGGLASEYLGVDNHSMGWFPSGSVFRNNVSVLTASSYTTNDWLGIAIDFSNRNIWFKNLTTGSNWNDGPTDNPATNSGGLTIAALSDIQIYPALNVFDSSPDDVFEINLEGPFFGTVPSGFTKYDGEAVQVAAPTVQRQWPLPTPVRYPHQNRTWIHYQQLEPPQFPYNQRDWPLPKPYRHPHTNRTWIQQIVDRPPVPFRQNDWPLPVPFKHPHQNRTWIQFKRIEEKPFFQSDWPLPVRPRPPHQNRTWINQISDRPPLPFVQTEWPIPGRHQSPYREYIFHPQLEEQQDPRRQLDWPLPIRRIRPAVTWINDIADRPDLPFRQNQWPLPNRRVPFQFDEYQNNINTITFVPPSPIVQRDWPLPGRHRSPYRTWTNQIADRPPVPFRQNEWPLPGRHRSPYRDWSNQVSSREITDVPFKNLWELPDRPFQFIRTWTQDGRRLAVPFRQNEWVLPRRPQQFVRSWLQDGRRVVTELPIRQTDWKLPITRPQFVRSWTQDGRRVVVTDTPIRQLDWPLPKRRPQFVRTFLQEGLRRGGQEPIRQSDWPLPIRPRHPHTNRIWIQPALALYVRPLPIGQRDWPLPRRSQYPILLPYANMMPLRTQVASPAKNYGYIII